MVHFSSFAYRVSFTVLALCFGSVNAQHTVAELQKILKALEVAGVNEFNLDNRALEIDPFLLRIDRAALAPVELAGDPRRVTGGAPAFFFSRGLSDMVKESRYAEVVEVRRKGLDENITPLFDSEKTCGRYETIFWRPSERVLETFDYAKTGFANALTANGYSLREAAAFNQQFKEGLGYRKLLFFGPDSAKAVIGEYKFKEAKETLLVVSEAEGVSQGLLERFKTAKDKEELFELANRLPEPDLPQLELLSAQKGRRVLAGMWRLGDLTRGDVMQKGSFVLVLCEFDRVR